MMILLNVLLRLIHSAFPDFDIVYTLHMYPNKTWKNSTFLQQVAK